MLQKLFIIVVCFMSYTGFSQSKIRKAEESLKKENNTTKVSTQSGGRVSNDDDSLGEAIVKETFGGLAVAIFYYTAYGILVEMPFEKTTPSSRAILNKHPYFNTENGNYSYEWNDNSAVGRATLSSRYIFENSILDGHHLNLGLRFYNKLALKLDYLQLWENNPNFGHDELAIYTALLKYHRVRTKKLDVWWGVGASYADGAVDDFGFTFGLGAEAFFAKPISLESNFNHTSVNGNSITKFNALINYYLKQFKISGGYERLKIGSQKFSMPSLGLGVSF
ncbi:hypothetical protein [Seonamhaeicola marinus]|uniref:Uncharacterized protein n=1 Tax=Seonamhaeicola marinus TaxID=1912246 RepID=A0A5D0HFC6_9FLAO|nr:hypothetical protein [Seonamhaeicola marinus]TYA70028.1 hypothetical protein FUA24_22330 [Seonamhaeicola marinus]